MDDLIRTVSMKTGLEPSMARVAVETVITYLKVRVPSPIKTYIECALNTDPTKMPEGLGEALGKLSARQR